MSIDWSLYDPDYNSGNSGNGTASTGTNTGTNSDFTSRMKNSMNTGSAGGSTRANNAVNSILSGDFMKTYDEAMKNGGMVNDPTSYKDDTDYLSSTYGSASNSRNGQGFEEDEVMLIEIQKMLEGMTDEEKNYVWNRVNESLNQGLTNSGIEGYEDQYYDANGNPAEYFDLKNKYDEYFGTTDENGNAVAGAYGSKNAENAPTTYDNGTSYSNDEINSKYGYRIVDNPQNEIDTKYNESVALLADIDDEALEYVNNNISSRKDNPAKSIDDLTPNELNTAREYIIANNNAIKNITDADGNNANITDYQSYLNYLKNLYRDSSQYQYDTFNSNVSSAEDRFAQAENAMTGLDTEEQSYWAKAFNNMVNMYGHDNFSDAREYTNAGKNNDRFTSLADGIRKARNNS